MVKLEEWMDIRALHEQGLSIREIARRSGRSRKAVRKVLRSSEPPGTIRRQRPSQLEPFEDHLRDRWFEYELSAVRLHEEVAELGYAGSEVTVRRFVAELKRSRYGPKGATVRFETPPGRQAQADWASAGRFLSPDGRLVSATGALSHERSQRASDRPRARTPSSLVARVAPGREHLRAARGLGPHAEGERRKVETAHATAWTAVISAF